MKLFVRLQNILLYSCGVWVSPMSNAPVYCTYYCSTVYHRLLTQISSFWFLVSRIRYAIVFNSTFYEIRSFQKGLQKQKQKWRFCFCSWFLVPINREPKTRKKIATHFWKPPKLFLTNKNHFKNAIFVFVFDQLVPKGRSKLSYSVWNSKIFWN